MSAHVEFYLDPFTALIEAMIRAEGGEEAFLRALRCSFPDCSSYGEAMARACKTIRNRALAYAEFTGKPIFESVRVAGLDPWTAEERPRRLRVTDEFIAFLGARWAPIGVINDPTNLNRNWTPNVCRIYADLIVEAWDEAPGGAEPA